MSVDRRALPRACAIAAWAAFFVFLWVSGDAQRYVGSRTAWVVPFGAVVLSLAALTQLAFALRGGEASSWPARREVAGLLGLLAPILLIAVIPAPSLGSLAVGKKQVSRALPIADDVSAEKPLTLFDIAAAARTPQYAAERGVTPGRTVEVLGLVSERRDDGTFQLARFVASCCAADAIPYTVEINAPGLEAPEQDKWVRAKGRIAKQGDALGVEATELFVVDEPADVLSSGA